MLLGVAVSVGALVWFAAGRTRDAQVPAVAPAGQAPAIGRTAGADAIDATAAVKAPTPLWRTVDPQTVAVKPPFADTWSQAGRVLLDVSGAAAAARTWQVGDRVRIDLPQLGERHEAPIDRLDQLGHSVAARGLMVDAGGQDRRFVVTVGPGRVFAYIDTAAGPYELVANDRLGWLLPSASMMAGFDYSQPDYWLPEAQPADGDFVRNAAPPGRRDAVRSNQQ